MKMGDAILHGLDLSCIIYQPAFRVNLEARMDVHDA